MPDGDLLGVAVEDLLDRLASERLGTGGSAACAICVAMAAALVAMVARRAAGHWPGADASVAQAESLRSRVAPMAQGSADAYARAVAALQRAAAARDDDSARDGLGDVLDAAALAPLLIAEAGADVAGLAAVVAASCRPEHAADAAAAAALAAGASQAAAHFVLINLATTAGDAFAQRARGAAAEASAACARALAASAGG
jgi:formiminotetrahydrofolate cyclodeaminase